MTKKPRRKKNESPFAENFQKVLDERGLSLKLASDILELPYSTVAAWLNEKSVPADLNAISRFCRKLNVDFEYLLTGNHSQANLQNVPLSVLFDEEPAFDGVYRVMAKKLKRRKGEE